MISGDASDVRAVIELLAATAMLFGALIATVLITTRARLQIGAIIAVDRSGTSVRRVVFAVLHLALAVWIFATGVLPLWPALSCVAGSMLLVYLTPGADDSASGETGVMRGWYGRRYAELEEWRLSGVHLRYRLFGEWTSAPMPAREHVRIREKLRVECSERESRFQD